jgi:hypothetical protein
MRVSVLLGRMPICHCRTACVGEQSKADRCEILRQCCCDESDESGESDNVEPMDLLRQLWPTVLIISGRTLCLRSPFTQSVLSYQIQQDQIAS